MSVQQDQLSPINTEVTFESINDSKADRIFHNGTDIIKCEFQTERPVYGGYYLTLSTSAISGSATPVARQEYIDRSYAALSPASADAVEIQYSTVISTSEIKLYSTTLLVDIPTGGSLKAFKAFTADAFLDAGGTSSYTFRTDLTPQQYEYKITFSTPVSGKYWRLQFRNGSNAIVKATSVTEVVIKDIPLPKITYFQNSGNASASFTLEKNDVLDMCYDVQNDDYYTIRFNSESVGSGLDPDDDFTTESGSTNFNTIRWAESSSASSFFRSISNNNLVYSTTSGDGQLVSKYKLQGDIDVGLDFTITTLTGSNSFFGLHALDATTQRFLYGVGITQASGTFFYKTAILNYLNSTTSADLLTLRPILPNVPSGSETWTIEYLGSSNWSVSGSINGSQTQATTGGLYQNSYISFQISAPVDQVVNDSFTFDVNYEVAARSATSGSLSVSRGANQFSSNNSVDFDEVVTSGDVVIEIFGTTAQSVNLTADNYFVADGDVVYPDIPTFTIEKVTDQGLLDSAVVATFNVIKDNTRTYNDYINGGVQITVTPAQIMYAKVLDSVYRFSVASPIGGLVDEDTSGVDVSLPGVVPASGVSSFAYSDSNGGFLQYANYDSNTSEVQIKTLTAADPPTVQTRTMFLDIPDWAEQASSGVRYQPFMHGTDNDTLFYLRRHGNNGLNSTKTSASDGVTDGTAVFTSATGSFVTNEVKKGDLVIINKTGYAGNGTYRVVSRNSATSLTLNSNLTATTSITFTIVSNAELLQFNTDPAVSAFSAVNIDDFNLRAGTNDTATVTIEVISAWGDTLDGKTCTFELLSGDGAVSPTSATTSGGGIATTQYTAGEEAGAVELQVTISD